MPVLALVLASLVASPPPPSPPPPAPPRGDADALLALAAVTAGEPTAEEVASAAAREADRAGAGLDTYARRARLSALLPRLSAEVRGDERSYRVVGLQGSGEVDYQRAEPGSAFLVRATWDLGELLAASGELAAERLAAARARGRDAAVRRATALLFERRRARLALLLDPPATPLARAEAELEVDRLTAELDAATGGLLSRGSRP